jgi:hypothetical protein
MPASSGEKCMSSPSGHRVQQSFDSVVPPFFLILACSASTSYEQGVDEMESVIGDEGIRRRKIGTG